MNIFTKNFKSILLFVVTAFVFFWVGVRYEQLERHKQEILMFANIAGDEIVSVNNIIESFGDKSKDEVALDYNLSALNDIGCSAWLDYLSDFDNKDMGSFFAGIDLALEKIDLPNDNQCVRNLLDMGR